MTLQSQSPGGVLSFYKKGVHRKYLCRSLFFNKVAEFHAFGANAKEAIAITANICYDVMISKIF